MHADGFLLLQFIICFNLQIYRRYIKTKARSSVNELFAFALLIEKFYLQTFSILLSQIRITTPQWIYSLS